MPKHITAKTLKKPRLNSPFNAFARSFNMMKHLLDAGFFVDELTNEQAAEFRRVILEEIDNAAQTWRPCSWLKNRVEKMRNLMLIENDNDKEFFHKRLTKEIADLLEELETVFFNAPNATPETLLAPEIGWFYHISKTPYTLANETPSFSVSTRDSNYFPW